jgi:hypothetical protein
MTAHSCFDIPLDAIGPLSSTGRLEFQGFSGFGSPESRFLGRYRSAANDIDVLDIAVWSSFGTGIAV